jgi:hypothetical protein
VAKQVLSIRKKGSDAHVLTETIRLEGTKATHLEMALLKGMADSNTCISSELAFLVTRNRERSPLYALDNYRITRLAVNVEQRPGTRRTAGPTAARFEARPGRILETHVEPTLLTTHRSDTPRSM